MAENKELTPGFSVMDAFNAGFLPAKKAARAQVTRIREKQPELSDVDLIKKLEKRYLSQVTTAGGVTGAAAAVPGAGTAASLAMSVADFTTTSSAAAVHVFSVLEVLGLDLEDVDLERALVLTIMLGGSGSQIINKVAERTGAHWGKQLTKKVPVQTLRQVNKILGPSFVTKYGTKQSVVVLGKALPFGFGAAIGGGLNLWFGKGIIKATRATIVDVAKGEPGVSRSVLRHLSKDITVEESDIIDGEVIAITYTDEPKP